MNCLLGLLVFLVGAASAVFLEPFAAQTLSFAIQPPPLTSEIFQPTFHHEPLPSKRVLAHRAVVINAENEARLPPHLLNPFYKNPRIAAALAKESWFGPGEEQVIDREAEKIPRVEVIKLLKQAGLARRR
ncbi:hypothetical protein RUM43_013909 [Polyplax serrata]|uniref:Uncharacterized protein n=1 Tax=Polyplax serrata TaxID=468196 RepID=A0AAN8RY68_POLSC